MKPTISTSVIALSAALLAAAPALGADLGRGSTKDAPTNYVAGTDVTSTNWGGFYAGVHGGWGWGNATTTDDLKDWCSSTDTACIKKFVGPFDYSPEGYLFGGTVGYNYQIGRIVIGAEGELGYMNLDGAGHIASSNPDYHQDLTFDSGLYGVAAARVGIAIDKALIYGKGGWAYFDGASSQKTTKPGFTTNETDAFSGWAYGGGIEYMLAKNLSVKVEYLRFDFGKQDGDQTADEDGYKFGYHTDLTIDTVKAGLNYRF